MNNNRKKYEHKKFFQHIFEWEMNVFLEQQTAVFSVENCKTMWRKKGINYANRNKYIIQTST